MRFSDIKQSLPKQFKREQTISPFNYYANKIEEPKKQTDEDEIKQIEKKERMKQSDVERLTQLYGIKEHETYDVERYKLLMKKWKNLTERISELTLNNYGIFRPTPHQAKRTNYNIDFSPLFYKLGGNITEERNQRVLRNVYYHLNPTEPAIPDRYYVRINENGELIITNRNQAIPVVEPPTSHRVLTDDENDILKEFKLLYAKNKSRNFSIDKIVSGEDEIYDMVEYYYYLEANDLSLNTIGLDEETVKKRIEYITGLSSYARFNSGGGGGAM
jgi:hypothetical protein